MRADTGPIGGDLSHEFIVLASTGESEVFYDDRVKLFVGAEAAQLVAEPAGALGTGIDTGPDRGLEPRREETGALEPGSERADGVAWAAAPASSAMR